MAQDAPEVPVQLKPDDFAYIGDSTPIFHWSRTVGVDGSYTLQWAKDWQFTNELHTIMGLADTMAMIPDSLGLANGLWYWRVQAVAPTGQQSGYQENPFSVVIDAGMPCDCSNLGDCNGDELINPLDVTYLVQYVYLNRVGPPPPIPNCPAVNGDWNCDTHINPVDVMMLVNYVYRQSGQGPCDPCP